MMEAQRASAGGMQPVHAWLLLLAACQSIPASGLVFGFPALDAMLKREGQFAELCDNEDDDGGGGGGTGSTEEDTDGSGGCTAQTLRYALMYTVASSCYFVGFFGHGLLLDRWGPRVDATLGTALVAVGVLLLALAESDGLDLFIPAYAIACSGGPGIHLSLFHISNLFTSKSMVQSFVVGLLTFSGMTLTLAALVSDGNVARRRIFFFVHAGYLACIVAVSLLVWPDTPFARGDKYVLVQKQQEQQQQENQGNQLQQWWPPPCHLPAFQIVAAAEEHEASADQAEESSQQRSTGQQEADGPVQRRAPNPTATLTRSRSEYRLQQGRFAQHMTELHKLEVKQQVRTQEFWLIMAFSSLHILRFNFFLSGAVTRLETLGDDDNLYSGVILSLILPFGVIFIPVAGAMLDHYGIPEAMLLCDACGIVYGAILLIPSLKAQIASFVVLSAHRQLLFASLYGFISAVFSFRTFGRMTGIINIGIAIFSTLQLPLFYVVEELLDGDFFWVDLAVFLVLPLFTVAVSSKTYHLFYDESFWASPCKRSVSANQPRPTGLARLSLGDDLGPNEAGVGVQMQHT